MGDAREGPDRAPTTAADDLVVQPKLVVGPSDDPAEVEADQIADRVVRALASPGPATWAPKGAVDATAQPSVDRDESGRVRRREGATRSTPPGFVPKRVQRSSAPTIGMAGGRIDDHSERQIDRSRSGGRPLDGRIRRSMERAMGADFSAVRLHVDSQSDELNHQIRAKAFTTGSDVFVRRRDYSPDTRAGQHLLAHELVHTIQQGASPATDARVGRVADERTIRRHGDHLHSHDLDDRDPTDGLVVTAHDVGRLFGTRAVGGRIHRLADPLSPSALEIDPTTKKSFDAKKFKGFKHYLGAARNLNSQRNEQSTLYKAYYDAYQAHAAAQAANAADPNLPALLQARDDAHQAHQDEVDRTSSFVTLERGMDAAAAAKYKMAIKELQRKLISYFGNRVKAGILKRDGKYGKSTERAVRRYQQRQGLPPTGSCDMHTWQAIDSEAGATASRGREEYRWNEDHEEAALAKDGSSGQFGMASAIDWAKKDNELMVNVSYRFDRTKNANAAGPQIAIDAIKQTWNRFNIVYKGPKDKTRRKRRPRNPTIKLTFNPVDGAAPAGGVKIEGDQRVLLFSTPHPAWATRGFPSDNDKQARSDAANWNVDDVAALKNIAGHEFGHAIGLEDEYGRRHKDMTRIAGKVDAYDTKETKASAKWFKTKIASASTVYHLTKLGAQTAALSVEDRNVVAQRYRDDYGAILADDLRAKMTAIKAGFTAAKATAAGEWQATRKKLAKLIKTSTTAADAAATAGLAAGRADRAYGRRTPIESVTRPMAEVRGAAARARHNAGLAATQQNVADGARAKAKLGDAAKARVAKDASSAAARSAGRAVANATQAAADATAASQQVGVSAKAARDATGADRGRTRGDHARARDRLATAEEDVLATRIASSNAEMARDLQAGIARRRAQAMGELVEADHGRALSAALAARALEIAEADVVATQAALAAAQAAAAAAGRLATHTARATPVAIAAGAAHDAAATAEAGRAGAANTATSGLAALSAHRLAYDESRERAKAAGSDATTNAHLWAWAHRQGLSSGSLMGREHGQNKLDGPALDHQHPLQPRHVRRYAEFVMKYKPDDIWDVAFR